MDLRNQQIKDTYGNLITVGTVAGTPTTGTLQNGAGSNVTALTINGTLTTTDDLVVDTNTLFVDASADRVGIGTSSPSALLTLQDGNVNDVSGSKLRMNLGPNPYWEIQARNSGTAATRQLGFYTDSISDDVLTLTQSGNVGIGLTSPSTILHINSGAAADTNVRLQAGAAGNHAKHTYSDSSNTVKWTSGYQSSSGNFGINEGDSFNATGITITSAGNVGIGTSSPVSGKLQVNHSNTESGIYVLEDNAGIAVSGLANFGGVISAPAIRFETSSTERFLVKTAEVVVNDPSNDVDFRVEGDTDTHLIFADAGNDRVGISTSSPSKLFHVAGTAHLPKLNGSTGVAAAENVAKTITYTISVYQTGVMHVMYASATGTAWGSGRQLYTSVYFGRSGGNAGVVTLNAGDTTDANAGDLSVTASGGDIVIAKTAGSGGNNGTLNIMIVSNDDIGQPVIT